MSYKSIDSPDNLSPDEDSSPEEEEEENEEDDDEGEESPSEEDTTPSPEESDEIDSDEISPAEDDEEDSSDDEEDQHENSDTKMGSDDSSSFDYIQAQEEENSIFPPIQKRQIDITLFGFTYIDPIVRFLALLCSLLFGTWILIATTTAIRDKQTHDYVKSDEGGRDCYLWTICIYTRYISFCHYLFVFEFILELIFCSVKIYVKCCQVHNHIFMRKWKYIFVTFQLFFHLFYMINFIVNTIFTGIASPIQWRCWRGLNPVVERYLPQMSNIIVIQYAITLFQLSIFCYSMVMFFVIIFASLTSIVVNVEFKHEDKFLQELKDMERIRKENEED